MMNIWRIFEVGGIFLKIREKIKALGPTWAHLLLRPK
jgi:hypothetical protein